MTMFYVATRARYVLVEADNEAGARIAGHAALADLHAELRERLGRDIPIEIRTIRPATTDEIDMMKWHHEMLAREAEWQARRNPA